MRLMQWMDASKALLVEARYQNLRRLVVGQGRVLFSQNFPGTAPKGCADLSCRTSYCRGTDWTSLFVR